MRSDDFLPLQEPTFYILLSLAPGEKHGYAILKDVETLSGGALRLGTGTLYGALSRLLGQGWIEYAGESSGGPGKPRKSYALTPAGRRMLAAETERLETLASLARARMGAEPA